MKLSRRDFVRSMLLSGGALAVFPACSRPGPPQAGSGKPGPAYLDAEREGLLAERAGESRELLRCCRLCPRLCEADRLSGATGYCRAPAEPVVSSASPHFGEESPLTGNRGSGTIFFANCNLRCVFCQNWPIAHRGRGRRIDEEELARMMLRLQERGCHNINLVTPTHVMPNILAATRIAARDGLRLPLVYNTGGYEREEMIKLLEGIVDIYMPDFKFMDTEPAGRYLGAADYPEQAASAIKEMFRQVGPLRLDANGIAFRGLMIRHLVMPNRLSNAKSFVSWVADNLDTTVYVNIMPQYRVEYRAYEFPDIARAITTDEFVEAMDWAEDAGLDNLDARSAARWHRHRRRL